MDEEISLAGNSTPLGVSEEEEVVPPPAPMSVALVRQPRRGRMVHVASPVDLPALSVHTCEDGHELVRTIVTLAIRNVQGDTICDTCNRVIRIDALAWHCDECIFDMCSRCTQAKEPRVV